MQHAIHILDASVNSHCIVFLTFLPLLGVLSAHSGPPVPVQSLNKGGGRR